ncbi:hypothetical protein ACQP1G_33975 [Nocardia sp. CA-107356]
MRQNSAYAQARLNYTVAQITGVPWRTFHDFARKNTAVRKDAAK